MIKVLIDYHYVFPNYLNILPTDLPYSPDLQVKRFQNLNAL